jgi:hypothetical protein
MGNLRGLLLAAFMSLAACRDIPSNVQSFYDRIKQGKCAGGTILKEPFYANYPGSKSKYTFLHLDSSPY